MKKYSIAFFLIMALLLMSCTKKLSEKSQNLVDTRKSDNQELIALSGMNTDAQKILVDQLEKLDEELFEFLVNTEDKDAKAEGLKDLRDKRMKLIKESMTEEELKNYMKALQNRAKKNQPQRIPSSQDKN